MQFERSPIMHKMCHVCCSVHACSFHACIKFTRHCVNLHILSRTTATSYHTVHGSVFQRDVSDGLVEILKYQNRTMLYFSGPNRYPNALQSGRQLIGDPPGPQIPHHTFNKPANPSKICESGDRSNEAQFLSWNERADGD